MAHDTLFRSNRPSRNRSAFCAFLLGALACGDGMSMPSSEGSSDDESGTPAAPTPPAPTTGAEATPPAAPAEPAASEPAGAGGAEEGAAANPIMLGTESPANGAAEGGTPSATPPADPAADPAVEAPAAGVDAASLARGDAPTRESATSPGPFEVTIVSTGLRDGPDYGSQTLHVPEGVEPPFAAVVIVPGFNTPESSIQAWGPFLASHGIVTLTIGTNTPTDSADARSRAVLDALETVKAENARAGGPLEGNLDVDHLGIMGWSLGGGGVLIASAATPSLKAAITMAAFSPGGQFPEDQVPTLFLAGSADPNAGGQSQGVFASLPDTTPKMLFEVQGGPHEIGNDPANANGEIGRYGLSWLEVFLVGDDRYRQFLVEPPTQASDFRENLTSAP